MAENVAAVTVLAFGRSSGDVIVERFVEVELALFLERVRGKAVTCWSARRFKESYCRQVASCLRS